ncbi:MAG: glycosyltransferase [Flavobacteriales bacterium]|jgi:glycosyltransferase involved in cell wall biosynthesis|nr:glycosyltransferase [Flavobacteriales bacterium]MBK9513238.1 glycosyltransferase [Flavobacteriales bacterium]MBP7450072.1 glycosyltransferase [Flavobacteriales bacterium]HOZ39842.1 glycosyltransferase family 2 protein [Flavobacteriales bacterium]
MKVTLITVCRNVAPVIRETLESILVQTHAEIELIVIDGASTDGTVEILREYADPPQGLPTQEGTVRNTSTSGSLAGYPGEVKDRRGITTLVSEPDKGIYDAMNKGLRLATGEVIGFVNAGDLLMTPTVIADVVNAFQRAHVDAVYGDIIMVDEHDIHKVHRTWLSGTYHRNNFRKGWMPPHVGTFIRKGVYDRHGHFNTDLRIGADYEILLRFLYRYEVPTIHIRSVLVRFRLGGMSNGSVRHILNANREVRASWGINGLQAPPLLVTRKLWSKVMQFFH